MIYLVVISIHGELSVRNYLPGFHDYDIDTFIKIYDLNVIDRFSSYDEACNFMYSYKNIVRVMNS